MRGGNWQISPLNLPSNSAQFTSAYKSALYKALPKPPHFVKYFYQFSPPRYPPKANDVQAADIRAEIPSPFSKFQGALEIYSFFSKSPCFSKAHFFCLRLFFLSIEIKTHSSLDRELFADFAPIPYHESFVAIAYALPAEVVERSTVVLGSNGRYRGGKARAVVNLP